MNLGIIGIGTSVVGVLLATTVIFGSWYTVDQGERAVILRNGKIIGVADAGLGFKRPIIDDIEKISMQSHNVVFDNFMAYSFDQQTATLRLSINYNLEPGQVEAIYTNYKDRSGVESRVIAPKVYDEIKNIFGKYTAKEAIQNRERMVADMTNALQNAAKGVVHIQSVQVENIDFSDAYETSVEERMLAEVDVLKKEQEAKTAEQQAKITVTVAQAEADSALAKATAEAKAITLRGDAEAGAIKARGDALRENPELIKLVQAEKWDGKLPTSMVPSGAIPFIDVK